ncbi:hypothetical protein PSPO01_07971 [Paraphaeosphaeria sporulosa]
MVAAFLVYQERLRKLGSVGNWLGATLFVPSSETTCASFSNVPTAACGILPRKYLPAPQEARESEDTMKPANTREANGVEAARSASQWCLLRAYQSVRCVKEPCRAELEGGVEKQALFNGLAACGAERQAREWDCRFGCQRDIEWDGKAVVHFAEASPPARRSYALAAHVTIQRASVGCRLDQGKNTLHRTFRALTLAWWTSHETVDAATSKPFPRFADEEMGWIICAALCVYSLNQLLAYSADDGCTQGRPLVYMQCHGCSELTCFACTLYMDLSTASTGSSAALVVEARHDRVTQSGANELCSWLHQTYMNKRAMTQCMTAVQGPFRMYVASVIIQQRHLRGLVVAGGSDAWGVVQKQVEAAQYVSAWRDLGRANNAAVWGLAASYTTSASASRSRIREQSAGQGQAAESPPYHALAPSRHLANASIILSIILAIAAGLNGGSQGVSTITRSSPMFVITCASGATHRLGGYGRPFCWPFHPTLTKKKSTRPRAGAETVDSLRCPDPCTCASSCIMMDHHGCTVSGSARRRPAAFSSQAAKRNANSRSNVSSARCCWVNREGFREPQRREWKQPAANPSFAQSMESKHPRRPEVTVLMGGARDQQYVDACFAGALMNDGAAVQTASTWNGAIWPLCKRVRACDSPASTHRGMQSATAGVLIGALRSVALDRVRGRNKKMVRVRRYYHGGFAARIESDTLPTAQTQTCGSLEPFWAACEHSAEDPRAQQGFGSKSNTRHGRQDAREMPFQTARCWRWTGLDWTWPSGQLTTCPLGAVWRVLVAVGYEECAHHVARCEGLGRAAGWRQGARALAGRRADPPAGDALRYCGDELLVGHVCAVSWLVWLTAERARRRTACVSTLGRAMGTGSMMQTPTTRAVAGAGLCRCCQSNCGALWARNAWAVPGWRAAAGHSAARARRRAAFPHSPTRGCLPGPPLHRARPMKSEATATSVHAWNLPSLAFTRREFCAVLSPQRPQAMLVKQHAARGNIPTPLRHNPNHPPTASPAHTLSSFGASVLPFTLSFIAPAPALPLHRTCSRSSTPDNRCPASLISKHTVNNH